MSLSFEQVTVGLTVSTAHTFTASELDRFQDHDLTASLLSRVSGNSFFNSVCSDISLNFERPTPPGAVITVAAKVTQVQADSRSIGMKVRLTRNGDVIARGNLTTQFF